jgi:hypothetical protein
MPTPADRRPDPEELLRRVQDTERRESRGRLKIFLGYASRVVPSRFSGRRKIRLGL